MFGIDVAEKQSVVLILSIRIALEHTCESGDLASAKCTLVCSLCSIGVGTQIGKWWFGLSQMHTFVFVVFHLCWNTNRKVVVWPQPNAPFCDRCVPFVKITNRKVVVWPQPNAHFCDRCVQFVMLWDGSQM